MGFPAWTEAVKKPKKMLEEVRRKKTEWQENRERGRSKGCEIGSWQQENDDQKSPYLSPVPG